MSDDGADLGWDDVLFSPRQPDPSRARDTSAQRWQDTRAYQRPAGAPGPARNGARAAEPPTQVAPWEADLHRDAGSGPGRADLTQAMPPPPLRTRPGHEPPQRAGWSVVGRSGEQQAPVPAAKGPKLRVDWPNCKGHGLCHELLPEIVRLDEWGFPVIANRPLPSHLTEDARRAVTACPTLALRLIAPS